MRMPSTGRAGHRFHAVPDANIARSTFNRSHGYKTTFDPGLLIPCYVDEALPGDSFNLNMSGFARLATPIKPVMDNMWLETHFFAVPYRLVWDNWQKFMGEQENPGDSTDYTVPQYIIPAAGMNVGTILDYMGIPTGVPNTGNAAYSVSSLPVRAMQLIWNEWFRDENLQNSISVNKTDSDDSLGQLMPYPRGKRHDYFTSCLPWPQKGDAVTLPLANAAIIPDSNNAPTWVGKTSGNLGSLSAAGTSTPPVQLTGSGWTNGENVGWGDPSLDITITSSSINSIREAFQIQKLLERDARGGTRYTEIIRSHFSVVSPDARLQRPEYLGGGRSAINVTQVPQTSSTDATTEQGNLAAYGTVGFSRGHGFVKSFTEHCILIGLVSVRADLTYQQGIERMWSRQTRFDFFWPVFSGLGEQAVKNKEIYIFDNPTENENTFGYQARWDEYRYKPSRVTGLFRSGVTGSLDLWHLAQEFASAPQLNAEFIEDVPASDDRWDRIVAVPSEPKLKLDAFFSLKCARPMPTYGVPGLIDHF